MHIYLSIYLPIYLSICLSIYLSSTSMMYGSEDPLPAPGAKVVPKTSRLCALSVSCRASVVLAAPARTSAEDIDKWDVDEEVG